MGGFQFHIDKPRPLQECERDIKILEESGNMGPNERAYGNLRLKALRADDQRGKLNEKIDYQVTGHPMEVD